MLTIRMATEADAEDLLKIYAPYVQNTAVSFEYEVPTVEEFRGRIRDRLKEYPYLVAEQNGMIVGYAYASSFHSREAYKHAAETSIYIEQNHHRQGIGRALYLELERQIVKQNVFMLCACISSSEQDDENLTDDSLRFHECMGYAKVGEHKLCGYKFNKWYSIVWMEKMISERPQHPKGFIPREELSMYS